jgi:small redox-active disulfide protein 2
MLNWEFDKRGIIMEIKVLGSGCASCKRLTGFTQEALKKLAIPAEVVHVTDMAEIAASGLMCTPGLIINGKIKSMGRVPGVNEIRKMIEEESLSGR